MNLFNRKSTHFTNGQGVYVSCHTGHYLKAVLNEGGTVSLSKVLYKGDTSAIFDGIWKRITAAKWEELTAEPKAGWHKWHEEIVLTFLFECGGKRYFTMDSSSIPAGRYYASQFVLDELKCGMSAEMQQAYRDAVTKAVNDGDLARIAVLVKEQDFRAKRSADIDLITTFASIMIVEEGEVIENYDAEFNRKKIAHWREHMGETFFLSAPIRSTLPFAEFSDEDLAAMIQAGKLLQESSLIRAWQEKSSGQQTT